MAKMDKDAVVVELTDKFRDSGAVLLTEYRGLSVGQMRICVVRSATVSNTALSRTPLQLWLPRRLDSISSKKTSMARPLLLS